MWSTTTNTAERWSCNAYPAPKPEAGRFAKRPALSVSIFGAYNQLCSPPCLALLSWEIDKIKEYEITQNEPQERGKVQYTASEKYGMMAQKNCPRWGEKRTCMYIDPTVYTDRPSDDRIPQELAIYDQLDKLGISYTRVDHDHADTMEDCRQIEATLGGKICKNLFLCNRQQTEFYLLMMPGEKPFKTKYLSAQLGCARLSFADENHMRDYLSTIPGSVSALELLFDTQNKVHLVIDRALLTDETISGHPGISTSTLNLKREDLLRYVESVGHPPIYVDLPDPRETGEA